MNLHLLCTQTVAAEVIVVKETLIKYVFGNPCFFFTKVAQRYRYCMRYLVLLYPPTCAIRLSFIYHHTLIHIAQRAVLIHTLYACMSVFNKG